MLTTIAILLALGVGGMWTAWRLRVPSILILLFTGLLAGPVAHEVTTGILGRPLWLDLSKFATPHTLMELVGLAIGLILFEGGLTLNWRDIAECRRVVGLLVTIGAGTTWCATSLAARFFLGLTWPLAVLLAAILVVTGPTVIGPLLRFIRPTGKVGPVLRWEGIVIDPLGAILAVLVFEVISSNVSAPGWFTAAIMLRGALLTLSVGIAIGGIIALALLTAIRRHTIPDQLQIPATLACIVAAFITSNALANEAGLVSATTMGIVMANYRRANIRHIVEFKENVSTLLIAILFIVMAARLDLKSFAALNFGAVLFVAALVLIIRPLSVLVSTLHSPLTIQERLFICGMAPRGIVAAGVASLFALRLEELGLHEANLLVTYTFLVVVATVILHGLTSAPLARRLGLAKSGQRGFLIIGADTFARNVAHFLAAEGLDVLVVDTNTSNIRDARLLGLPVALGNALSSNLLERVELSSLGHLLALTSNHEVNAMAAVQFSRVFGRTNVFQIAEKHRRDLPTAHAHSDRELVARTLFGPDIDHPTIEKWLQQGASLRKTRLSTAFALGDYLKHNAGHAIPLLIITFNGVALVTTDALINAMPGDQIVSLVLPEITPRRPWAPRRLRRNLV